VKRGRPAGWRKPDAKRHMIMVRISAEARHWLSREASSSFISMSEVVRQLIEKNIKRLR
jgi:hypothetical protein